MLNWLRSVKFAHHQRVPFLKDFQKPQKLGAFHRLPCKCLFHYFLTAVFLQGGNLIFQTVSISALRGGWYSSLANFTRSTLVIGWPSFLKSQYIETIKPINRDFDRVVAVFLVKTLACGYVVGQTDFSDCLLEFFFLNQANLVIVQEFQLLLFAVFLTIPLQWDSLSNEFTGCRADGCHGSGRGSKESRQGSSRAIQYDYQERGENEIMSQKDEEKKKKKKQSILEKEIFSIMEKSMKTALDTSHEIPPLEYLIFRWNTRGLKGGLECFLNLTTTTFCAENKEKVVNSSRIHDFLVEISGIEPRKLWMPWLMWYKMQ